MISIEDEQKVIQFKADILTSVSLMEELKELKFLETLEKRVQSSIKRLEESHDAD